MSDPDVEHEERIARDYLIEILRLRCVAGIDPEGVATHYIAWLRRDRGWRPALKPPPNRARPPNSEHDAATYQRGLKLARRALAAATAERTADQDHETALP